MPPEPIRRLRTHTRYRRHLTQARTAEKQRVEKLLEDGHLKLSVVISDIHGVSGRDMLDAIAAGQRDPTALAQLARGTMRGKIRRLEEALDCSFFTGEHAAVLAMMLAAIDHYTAQIEPAHRQDRGAGRALPAPDRAARRRARHRDDLRPGHHRRDRRRHDGVPHRRPPGLLGQMVTPGQAVRRETQGQQRHRPRQPLPRRRPRRSRISAGRTQSFLGARYRRLARRMPKKKALVATGNSMLTIIHALLSDPDATYTDLGADYYEQRMHARRQARNHVRGLRTPRLQGHHPGHQPRHRRAPGRDGLTTVTIRTRRR